MSWPVSVRNMLTLKQNTELHKEELWLKAAYSNIVCNLIESAITITKSSDFDSFSEYFYGLNSVKQDKDLYRAMLEITSYFWASKGGKGKLLEKSIASAAGKYSEIGFRLSEIPNWLEASTNLYSSSKDNVVLKESELSRWKTTGKSTKRVNFDLVNLIDDKLVLLELKNRVDSGGTAARREALQDKFLEVCKLIETDEKIFLHDGNNLSLIETIYLFGIRKLEMNLGLLYNTNGIEATIEDDRREGFYSTSKTVMKGYAKSEHASSMKIIFEENPLRFIFEKGGMAISVNMLYGNDVTRSFTANKLTIKQVLSKISTGLWDDIWLCLNLAISQRKMLLQYNDNHIKRIKDLYDSNDADFMNIYRKFLNDPTNSNIISQACSILRKKMDFSKIPPMNDLNGHLSDCLYAYAGYTSRKNS